MMKIFYALLLSSTLATTINGMEEEKKTDKTKKIEKEEEQDFIPKQQDCVSPIIIKQSNKKELFKKQESYYEAKTSSRINTSPRSEKNNPLFTAIEEKNYTTLHNLLFLDPNAIDKNGNTSLHIAARDGFIKIVKILLTQKKLDFNRKNIGGMTAQHLAAQKQYYDIVELFLKHPGCDSSITTMNKRTIRDLIEASQTNRRLKCFAYVTLNWEINKQAKNYCTSAITPSLETAVQNIRIDISKTYVNQIEQDRNIPKEAQLDVTDEFLYQMLKLRIEEFQRNNCSNISSSKSDTQLITAKKITPNKDNEQSDKKTKHPKLTKKSKSYRDPESIETKQNSPLIIAAKANDLTTVTELLNLDYNCTDICENTPLIYAATLGYAKAVNMLLLHPETKPNETNKWDMTALLIAASKYMESKGHRTILHQLILHPAVDASIKNMHGKMAETLIDPTNSKLQELLQNRRQLDEIINAYVSKTKRIDHNLTNTSPSDETFEIIKYGASSPAVSTVSFKEIEKKTVKNLISKAKLTLPSSIDENFIEQMIEYKINTSQDIHSMEIITEIPDKKQLLMRKTQ